MIPDKIYIDFIDDAICMSSMSETPNGGIEYIRKEALLEWVKKEREFIEGLFTEGDASFYDGQDDAYNNLIAKLQSL